MARFTNLFAIGRGIELFVMCDFSRRFGKRRMFTGINKNKTPIRIRLNIEEENIYSSDNLCFRLVGKTEEICCVDGCRGRRVRFFREFR